jgi:hypothetical protein
MSRRRIIESDACLQNIAFFVWFLPLMPKKLGLELALVTTKNGQGARFLLWGVLSTLVIIIENRV